MATTNYYIGKGPLNVADRDASGTPGALEDVGEVMIALEITKDYKSNVTSRYEINHTDAHVPVSQEVKGTLTVKEPTAKNLERIAHGTKTANAGGSVTAQAFPAGIIAGETHRLPGFAGIASALSIVDSAVTPATLVLGTDYTVDLNYGTVTFISVSSKTQPFKASYTQAASSRNSILTRRVINKYLRFHGINIGNNDGPRKLVVELYDCTLLPASKLDLKSEDFVSYEIPFVCLADPNKSATDTELGQYGNILSLE
jgi:hypothetical protein